jgi:hypothetical protein
MESVLQSLHMKCLRVLWTGSIITPSMGASSVANASPWACSENADRFEGVVPCDALQGLDLKCRNPAKNSQQKRRPFNREI